MRVFECLNCGFKFKIPARQMRTDPTSMWTGKMYYIVFVCPKCGSDAIHSIEVN